MAEVESHLPSTDDFAFQHSSPHSLREPFSSPPAPPLDAGPNINHTLALPQSEHLRDVSSDHDLTQISLDSRRTSTVSSVSSFPPSVLHHEPLEEQRTPSRSPRPQSIRHDSTRSFGDVAKSPRRQDYASGFRNPSSVRAMQMRDELEDSSEEIAPHRRSGSQYSVHSHGSALSARTSPSKRLSRSTQSSPLKSSKLKNEFPLVLLHCTLLPPASGVYCGNDLFGALLPEEYRRRWAALQERLALPEVKARGILIPHPHEDYELLEERLLESLELEKPRIRSNHFHHPDNAGADSGFESASQTDDDTDNDLPHEFKCPDCGKGIGLSRDRKWEIKVYAANGLMRAGAWSAAWREMEKVDIEIGMWMPEDIRQEVNSRLEVIQASEHDEEPPPHPVDDDYQDLRQREIYGTDRRTSQTPTRHTRQKEHLPTPLVHPVDPYSVAQKVHDNSIVSVMQDRKNIIIVLLGILLMYLMTNTNHQGSPIHSHQATNASMVSVSTTTITSTTRLSASNTLESEIETAVIARTTSALEDDEEFTSALRTSQPDVQQSVEHEPTATAELFQIPSNAEQSFREEGGD